MKVVVTGSRCFEEHELIWKTLDLMHAKEPIRRLAHGDCPDPNGVPGAVSVDQECARWADAHGVPFKPYPADWKKHGRAAGPIRNREMLKAERPHLVIAFPGGQGTHNCVRTARKLGLRVVKPLAPEGNE